MITAAMVNELRKRTNVGMMECKKALTETNGDLDEAVKYLRQKGKVKWEGLSGRGGSEGIIAARLSADGKSGILVEVNCETDFVSRNEGYVRFVDEIADTLAASGARTLEEALAVKKDEGTLEDFVKAKVIELGENIRLRRFERLELKDEGAIAQYIHMGGRVGVLLEVSATAGETATKEEFRELVKDITLHIAAAKPKGLCREDIPEATVEAEKEIYRAQLANEGKPVEMIEKILPGKVGKFLSDSVLLEQAFVRDPSGKTIIKELIAAKGKALGDTLAVKRFVRFGLGE